MAEVTDAMATITPPMTPTDELDIDVVTPKPRTHVDSTPLPTDSMISISLSDTTRSSLVPPTEDDEKVDATHTPFDRELKRTRKASIAVIEGLKEFREEIGVQEDDVVQQETVEGSSPRSSSNDSEESLQVDWEELDKVEKKEDAGAASDETTLLLARLEQENNAITADPKSVLRERRRTQSRPPSVYQLKKLVQEQGARSVRLSLLPAAAPMTELDFWAALVQNYPQTAQRLPTVTSNKIRAGVPAPLRGVVWASMAGARDAVLEEKFDKYCLESSPYETIINKDIGRSFPGVAMFRDADGEGQRMLACVLKCYSLYDTEIGYCQGLGFLVGPLLMNMGEKQAFCVLARLMDDYDLRSCFLPNLSGLHLRIYQFQRLLHQHLPELAQHLEKLDLSSAYLTPWFLSFFATACPLPLLFRIYDVIFAEGASETLMRVALAIMQRNQRKLLSFTEMEDAMQLLLSRGLWDPYGLSATSADELVGDFVSFTGVVSRESLQALEGGFREAQALSSAEGGVGALSFFPAVQQTASRFLQRKLFTYSSSSVSKAQSTASSQSLAPGFGSNTGANSRPNSLLVRTPSKQSLSTLYSNGDSAEGSISAASTVATEITDLSRDSAGEYVSLKGLKSPTESLGPAVRVMMLSQDKDLHVQIEDLLLALTELQREHASLAIQLQKEREERSEDRTAVKTLIDQLKQERTSRSPPGHRRNTLSMTDLLAPLTSSKPAPISPSLLKLVEDVETRMTPTQTHNRKSSGYETKTQLKVKLSNYKDQLQNETTRTQELNRQLAEKNHEADLLRDDLSKNRARMQKDHAERERLQKVISDLRAQQQIQRGPSRGRSPSQSSVHSDLERSTTSDSTTSTAPKGLREFRLGRIPTGPARRQEPTSSQPPKRTSSLAVSSSDAISFPSTMVSSPNHSPQLLHGNQPALISPPAADESLLQDLVTAKTAEAIARQELDELRGKFEQMRRQFASATTSNSSISSTPLVSRTRAGSTSSSVNTLGLSVSRSSTNNTGELLEWSSQAIVASPGTPPTSAGVSPGPGSVAAHTPAAAAGWGVGGGFFGWGKRNTSSAMATPPAGGEAGKV